MRCRRDMDSSAMNNLEEAVLYFGYAAAYAMGYKAKSEHVPYHHSKIIQFVLAYTQAYRLDLKNYANRFQGIRIARNAIKYPEPPGAPISAKQMRMHFEVASMFWQKFRETPTKHLSQRLLSTLKD